MAVTTLVEKMPQWAVPSGENSAEVVASHVTLSRNISGFPFPERCSDEEKGRIEERVLRMLDQVNLLSKGSYHHLSDLPSLEARFLAERRLITFEMLRARGAAGVYVSDDQAFSLMVNGNDHLTLRVIAPGQQLQQAWTRANTLDDTIAGAIDYVFNDRLGFLSSTLENTGTGLKAGLLMHLPGLVLSNQLAEHAGRVRKQRIALHGVKTGGAQYKPGPVAAPAGSDLAVSDTSILEHTREQSLYSDLTGAICGHLNEAAGDLFLLVNTGSLGESEEEILFHLRHAASEIIAAEADARAMLVKNSQRGLEDRVNRAYGVATRARLLGFSEGLSLLSSLRLGITTGALPDVNLRTVNELLLASQGAHLEVAKGQPCDALTLSMERADLFRQRFAKE